MKFKLLFAWLLFLCAKANATLIDSVNNITGSSVAKYGKFETGIKSLTLSPPFISINPYDSSDVNMYAIFTAPDGKKYRRNAFWYVPYSRCNTCVNSIERTTDDSCSGWNEAAERMSPTDPQAYLVAQNTSFPWRVRFAPPQTGTWSYKVYVYSVFGTDSSGSYSFTVSASTDKGFIKADSNLRLFRYRESGDLFTPLSINCVKNGNDTVYNRVALNYATMLMSRMAPYGGNLIRVWMRPDDFGIEWQSSEGIGNYTSRQPQAFDLDSVVKLAEEQNVYIHLTLSAQDEINFAALWSRNPYHTTGFAIFKNEFFSDADCQKFFKQRIRYIMARWGYSPHIFSFEPMQEINLVDSGMYWSYNTQVKNWVQTMIQYGRSQDTNHMYTVSCGSEKDGFWDYYNNTANSLYNLPELDYIDVHHYGSSYNVNFERNFIQRFCNGLAPNKPMLFGELGWGWGGVGMQIDNFTTSTPTQKPIYNNNDWHNSLWSTLFGGAGGPCMYWGNVNNIMRGPYPGSPCWGGQYLYFKPVKMFTDSESIFMQQPQPISNICTGNSPKDYLLYNTLDTNYTNDTLYNKCSCLPKWSIGNSLFDSAYISNGITTTKDSVLEVFGLRTNTRAIGWIHYKENYWYNIPHHCWTDTSYTQMAFLCDNNSPLPSAVPVRSNDSILISALATGSYRLTFYSAYPQYEINSGLSGAEDGGVIPGFTDTVQADCDGNVRFRIPDLKPVTLTSAPYAPDYGFKLTWISPVTETDITVNTTWNASSHIPGDVTVYPGNTLTISGSGTVIIMPENSKISVKPGAKLVVDGATITSGCDSLWFGIRAEGNSAQRQLATTQATVEIKNGAVIEHARFGVSLWDRNNLWTSTGGIVKAFNSTFRNNKKAVEFQAYHNHTAGGAPLANLSSFTNCTFEVNNGYKGDSINYPFDSHVTMWEVEGIRFRGCKFKNEDTLQLNDFRGYGIISYNAGYSVKPYCTGTISYPCNGTLVRSEFKGFISGIIAEGDLNGSLATVTVDKADFDRNSIGIRIKNVENASVLRSRFDIGNGVETNVTDCYQNVGIFTTNAHSFRIEDDTLTGHTYGYQHSGWMNFGVVTEASGDQWNTRDNDIYRCEFLDLSVGAYALGRNSSPYTLPGGATKGLRYLCNRFKNNDKDIMVVAPANEGLPSNQWGGFVSGSPNNVLSAGNTFIDSSLTPGNIDNTNGHHFTYYHYGTNSTPYYYSNVTLVQVAENTCASRLEGGDDPKLSAGLKHDLLGYKTDYRELLPDLKTAYLSLMDGGNTEDLIDTIDGMNAQDAQDYLLDLAPYISETVFRHVADSNLMSAKMLQEVLSATPDVLRNPDFLNYLEDQDLDRQELEDASVYTSERTKKEAEISLYEHELDRIYNFLVTDVKDDTLYEYAQTIPELLFERGDMLSAYEMLGYYYSIRNMNSATDAYGAISTRFSLSGDMLDTYEAYGTVWNMLKNLYNQQSVIEDMGGSNINSLSAIAEEFSGKGIGYIASGLLERAQVIPRPLCVQEIPVGRMPIPAKAPKKLPAKEISVYPNPGRDKIIFSYDLPDVKDGFKLVITDMNGRQVQVFHATGNKGLIHWNTGELSNGVYFYQVSDGRQKHGSGKVVIMK